MVEQHKVARREGDGAGDEIDDKYDGEEYTTKDQRAETHTTFYERDIDKQVSDPRQAKRLKRALRLQEGERKPNRNARNHEEDKRRLIGAYTSHMEVTPAQKRRVEHLVMDVMSVNSFGHYSMEKVILATINVVAREDGRMIEEEKEFRSLVVDAEMTNEQGRADLNTLKRLRALVRERIPSR